MIVIGCGALPLNYLVHYAHLFYVVTLSLIMIGQTPDSFL